jgi:hypothetical protein
MWPVGDAADRRRPRCGYRGWLALTALAYALLHHVGSLPDGLGEGPRGTRWADWLDLATPYAVLLPALLALVSARADRRVLALFALGALAYAQGHGVHLAANSVGNADPGPVAHLWDEDVGHALWYAGAAAVTAALATTTTGAARGGPLAYALALGAGTTWGTNAVGGGAAGPGLGLAVAVALVAYGLRHRHSLAAVLAVGWSPALVIIAADLLARPA